MIAEKKLELDDSDFCPRCHKEYGDADQHELYDEYVCDDCYQGFISYCENLADSEQGK